MAQINRLAADVPISNVLHELEAHGAVIIERFISAETLARLNGEIDPVLANKPLNHGHPNQAVEFFHGPQTRHLTGLAAVSDTFTHDVLLHPIYKAIGDHFLLQNCSEYILNIGHVIERGPASKDQLIHRDHDVWPRRMTSLLGGQVQFASLLALSEYTAEMGATRLVPGSHEWPTDREPRPDEIATAEMTPGSAVIYLGNTLHGAGSNTTAKWRRGMHASFCLGWLRTEENNYLALPLDRVRRMPRRAQELLGFGVHDGIAKGEGFLGALDNRNPADMMAAGEI